LRIVAEESDFQKRAEAMEKSRKEIAALQERIKTLRRRYMKAEPKAEPRKEQPERKRGAA
jgi:hypothetical protein